MKRKITASADNGSTKIKMVANVEFTHLTRDESKSKTERIKNDLYNFLSLRFSYSDIKID